MRPFMPSLARDHPLIVENDELGAVLVL